MPVKAQGLVVGLSTVVFGLMKVNEMGWVKQSDG